MGGFAAVGHLDADCFYVSAERVRDPFLHGVPLGVLGNHGACVIARSYEMRERGVRTGEPIWDALKLCPDGVYLKRDFRWYEVLSREMLGVVRGLSPRVEYYSIDEFFFEVTRGGGPADVATAVRDTVKAATGLSVSVAIARTRTLSKLFVETVKPFGAVTVLDAAAEREILASLPVDAVPGIAGRRAARLAPYSVKTCLDFTRMRRDRVRSLLTITGEQLWRELNGEQVLGVEPTRPAHKMLSRGGSIGDATADPHAVYGWLVRNLERLIEELEYHQVRAGKMTVWLSYAEGPDGVGDESLDVVSDRFDVLLDAARGCLRRAWRGGDHKVTRMQVIATNLRGPGLVQRSLFEPGLELRQKQEALARLKREVNARVGRFALRSGATLLLPQGVYRDRANGYDICDVRGKVCF